MAILVVEDDPAVGRSLGRSLARLSSGAEIVVAASAAEALAALGARGDWGGFLVDVHLGDGQPTGLDVLAVARAQHPDAPALVLTGSTEHDIIHRAAALDARYLLKPIEDVAALRPFARRASLLPQTLPIDPAWVRELGARCGLSPAQVEVLHAYAGGESTAAVADRTGRSRETVKKHVRQILRRAGAASIADLLSRARRG